MNNLIIFLRKILIVGGLLGMATFFDYVTGYEVSSFPLYLLPIGLAFWEFGSVGGYLVAFLSGVLWMYSDCISGNVYSHCWIRYQNGLSRTLVFSLFVWGLSIYAKTLETHRKRLDQVRRLVPICHGCGKILWPDGKWKKPDEALDSSHSHAVQCPSCLPGHTGTS